MQKRWNRLLFWIPRIGSMLFIVLIVLFSLDTFNSGLSAQEFLTSLFMHNIPAIILVLALILFWKNGLINGIIYILLGIAYIALIKVPTDWHIALSWYLTIAGPAFIVGIFFIISWLRRK